MLFFFLMTSSSSSPGGTVGRNRFGMDGSGTRRTGTSLFLFRRRGCQQQQDRRRDFILEGAINIIISFSALPTADASLVLVPLIHGRRTTSSNRDSNLASSSSARPEVAAEPLTTRSTSRRNSNTRRQSSSSGAVSSFEKKQNVSVVTQPPRRGKRRKESSPVQRAAVALHIPVHTPEQTNDNKTILDAVRPTCA
jgi:hypothetical protein